MGRLKININGIVADEKEIVTIFVVENTTYVVLNSDKKGSMGLPIIWISKINSGVLEKVENQVEWQKVKDTLKLIIANSSVQYSNVGAEIKAFENYYTQLTLPDESYQAIKNNYKPVESVSTVLPVGETPYVPNIEVSEINQPVVETAPIPEVAPIIAPVAESPVAPLPIPSPVVEPPVVPAPAPVVIPSPEPIPASTPVMEPVVAPAPVIEQVQIPTPTPVPNIEPSVIAPRNSNPVSDVTSNSNLNDKDLEQLKDTFLKACENVFEGLLKNLQNK